MYKPFIKKYQVKTLVIAGNSSQALDIEADECRVRIATTDDDTIKVTTERERILAASLETADVSTLEPGLLIRSNDGFVSLHSIQNASGNGVASVVSDLTGYKESIEIANESGIALPVVVELVHYVPTDEIGL